MAPIRRLVYLVSLLVGAGLATHAQAVQQDSLSSRPTQVYNPTIGRLKGALRRLPPSLSVADSLLSVARQLDYAPGQVIALVNLAILHRQQQHADQGAALLQEAAGQAAQIRDMGEAGWVMGQLGRIQAVNRGDTNLIASLAQVMGAVGSAMSAIGISMGRRPSRMAWPDAPTTPRIPDRRGFQGDFFSGPPPGFSFRIKPTIVDRWIDTLIQSPKSSPQVVRQLLVNRKLRDSSQALSRAFARSGDFARAYRYYLQYTAYKDSLNAEVTSRRLAALTYKQNLLRKETQIQLLTREQQLRDQHARRQQLFVLALIGGVVLLIALLVVLSRNNRAKHLANQQLNQQKEALQQTLTELKATQAQLIQSEKMASLGEVTAGIAHEIQNPLNFVNNFADINADLIDELLDQQQQPRRDEVLEGELLGDIRLNMQKINEHGNRAAAIVRGMLEHARSGEGAKTPTDLNALTEEYLNLAYHGMRARTPAFDVTLTTRFQPGLAPVTVVPQEVGRVLLNVFNNALYAVQKRQQTDRAGYTPEIQVTTKQTGRQVCIQVRDNGTGVPPAIREKVFQPFFTTKPTGQGTGLGLSLSYDIITKGYGGTLTLDSEEGSFTELTLTLPAA